jgi:RNA polymerase-binding transcription factor
LNWQFVASRLSIENCILLFEIMSNPDKEIEKLLSTEIEKTTLLIDEYRELTKPIAPENSIGRISRMDAINNKSINEAALRKAEAKLKNLELALASIDDQDFGKCAKCKKDIPIQRIMLVPQSRFCVNCAS